ncbi:non-heme iron oxygenase ferredoxin subunit [Pandoraea sputorum]|uniref:non-heme iron oxygenase ferredoxin subunit n=1 Tax=Pandoraea sputorum TaxID=93222 RepID=UPI001241554F|nr:non-heme iron oxygenase ferredoxin subunit [Pandoraea sputorum]MCE4061339.1 non-heme iron oxygenase ferredoxin subunit [Pandoraea sputorum]VVE80378.1 Ferredoxin CarAc [Pandoraea sputorum]
MEKKVFLCRKSDVPGESVIQVCPKEVDDGLAVYQVDGKFYVTEDLCTHGMVALSGGDLQGTTIYCPLHGGAFDICSGNAVEKPCTTPLKTYRVVVEGDEIFGLID